MKRNIYLYIFLTITIILLSACSNLNIEDKDALENKEISNQNKYKNNIKISIDEKLILNTLEKVCSNIRNFGSEGESISQNYLKSKLEEYGYIVTIQDFEIYKQTLASTTDIKNNIDYFNLNPYKSEKKGNGKNIIGKRNNNCNDKKTIYLTAHYDTTSKTKGIIDNGSGVSIVLEVARQLSQYNSPFNIEIVFFSGEEYYRSGSRAFISNLTEEEKQNIIGCINVDMVGEKNAGGIVMRTFSEENNILSLMINNQMQNPLFILDGGYSDDLSFYFGKIPAITLANKNSNPDLAKQKNQLEYIDLQELKNTAYLIVSFLNKFDINMYNNFLTNNISFPSNKTVDKIGVINGFKLNKINSYLLENGYDSKTEYVYENNVGKKYILTEKVSKFVNPTTYNNFKTLIKNVNWNWFYSVNNDLNGDIKINYSTGVYFGEIKGDVSTQEALNILNAYYKAENKRLMGG